jgi:gluconolactonase
MRRLWTVAFMIGLAAWSAGGAGAQAPGGAAPAAPPPPRPKMVPGGAPTYQVDLMTREGVAVFGGQWRAMDAKIVEGPPRPNAGAWKVSHDLQPKAAAADFDDSSWPVVDAPMLVTDRRGGGGVFMTWYRIALTIPPTIGAFDPAGAIAVFHIVVDDYAEVAVNGQIPRLVGRPSGNMIVGFNLPNRAVLSEAVQPGEKFQVAVLGINGPIALAPLNPVFIREARVEFFK